MPEQNTMKALVCHAPGRYNLDDVPVPQIITPTDAIGRVTMAAICASDLHVANGYVPSITYPKILGHEFCIEVVEVGSAVEKVKPGDRCVAIPGCYCGECPACKSGLFAACPNGGVYGGLGIMQGAHAEYVRIGWADKSLIPIPDGLTEEDVILLPDMLGTGYWANKDGGVSEGKSVAVIGVGPVGQSTCLLAKKLFGAKQVIGIETLEDRLDLAKQNGVIDAGIVSTTSEEVVGKVMDLTGGRGVDSVIETVGSQRTMAMAVAIAGMGGIILTTSAIGVQKIDWTPLVFGNKQIRLGLQKGEGLAEMLQMIVQGRINPKYMLTHRAPLNDIMTGYKVFGNHEDGCVKWIITPYER